MMQEGEAEGSIIGGNLCTLNLLQGTEYMPDIRGSLLFIEDDSDSQAFTFDRDLQSLIHQPDFNQVRGIVIGRFERKSNMTRALLQQIISTKKELTNLPVIANVDFGHTSPLITFPIGGTGRIKAASAQATIEILEH